jgi:hypothetical protein
MNTELSQDFQVFHQYVFGDYRYYHYNGLPEDICTKLVGKERKRAESLLLSAIKKHDQDERPIRAAGHLKLQSAIPLLEKRLSSKGNKLQPGTRSSIIWALLKISRSRNYLDALLEMVTNSSSKIEGLAREDATDLLSEFGKEPVVINALFKAFVDGNLAVCASALYALRKIFEDDVTIQNLFDNQSWTASQEERKQIIEQAKKLMET